MIFGDDKPKLLNSRGKGFASAHAGVDDSGLRGFGALIHVADPGLGHHEGMESTVDVKQDAFQKNPSKLLGAPAASDRRSVRLDRGGVGTSNSEQPRGKMLQEEQDKLHGGEAVFSRSLKALGHI